MLSRKLATFSEESALKVASSCLSKKDQKSFVNSTKCSETSRENLLAVLSKFHSTCWEEILDVIFFRKKVSSNLFSDYGLKTSGFFRENSSSVVQNAFSFPGELPEVNFFFINMNVFSFNFLWKKIVGILENYFRHKCQNCFPCLHAKVLRKNRKFDKKPVPTTLFSESEKVTIRDFWQQISEFSRNSFVTFEKTTFYLSKGTFRGKTVSSGNIQFQRKSSTWAKVSGVLMEIFLQCCHKRLPVFQRSFWGYKVFCEKKCNYFCNLINISWNFWRKTFCSALKISFYLYWKKSSKYFSSRKVISTNFLRILSQQNWAFDKKFRRCGQKRLLSFQRNFLR